MPRTHTSTGNIRRTRKLFCFFRIFGDTHLLSSFGGLNVCCTEPVSFDILMLLSHNPGCSLHFIVAVLVCTLRVLRFFQAEGGKRVSFGRPLSILSLLLPDFFRTLSMHAGLQIPRFSVQWIGMVFLCYRTLAASGSSCVDYPALGPSDATVCTGSRGARASSGVYATSPQCHPACAAQIPSKAGHAPDSELPFAGDCRDFLKAKHLGQRLITHAHCRGAETMVRAPEQLRYRNRLQIQEGASKKTFDKAQEFSRTSTPHQGTYTHTRRTYIPPTYTTNNFAVCAKISIIQLDVPVSYRAHRTYVSDVRNKLPAQHH